MPAKEPTRDNSLLAKMKAIEARAIERSRQRRAQESPPFPPEAKAEPAIPEQTAQLIEFGVVSRNPRFFRQAGKASIGAGRR